MRWVIWLGWIEGLSAVLLMCIATPVKYLMDCLLYTSDAADD